MPGSISSPAIPRRAAHCVHRVTVPSPSTTSSRSASWLALPGRAGDIVLPHATPLADLLEVVLGEGTVTLCTQCAARRGIAGDEMLPGIRIAGATVFVEETLRPDAQALVY